MQKGQPASEREGGGEVVQDKQGSLGPWRHVCKNRAINTNLGFRHITGMFPVNVHALRVSQFPRILNWLPVGLSIQDPYHGESRAAIF